MADFPELDQDHREAVSQLTYFGRAGGRDAGLLKQSFWERFCLEEVEAYIPNDS